MDDDGCNSMGFTFKMAFVHSVPGSSAEYRDEFIVFFNKAQERDCTCSMATLTGVDRDPYQFNVTSLAGNEQMAEIYPNQATADPITCNKHIDLVVVTGDGDMKYDGNNMPFIASLGADRSFATVQWNGAAELAATSSGAQMETVTDDEGCTSDGWLFDMAFVYTVIGS